MKMCFLVITVAGLLPLHSPCASALTIEQFSDICVSGPGECSDHPVLRAYVGGALDMIATLNDETGHLDTLYCTVSEELFDVSAIITFMVARRGEYATRNAMAPMIRYFEVNGGCETND